MSVNFENTEIAFRRQSTSDLWRSYTLFKLVESPFLGKAGPKILNAGFKLGLPLSGITKATIFKQFCGGESLEESVRSIDELAKFNVKTILDYAVEGEKNETGFDDAKEEVLRTINITTNSKSVPFAVFKLTALASFDLLAKVSAKEVLSKDEQAAWSRVVARVDAIYEKANRHNLPVMVDAEETWIQPAIDELTEIKMRKYNSKKALVYTTAQLYRKDRLDYIRALVTRGQTDKFHVGIKLVRGAYMEKERLRAKSMGYASPIQDTKADADRAYDQAVEFCLKNIAQAAICIGTHNEYSCSHAIALMKRFNIEVDDQRVYFSQLYGMSDQLTFNLAEAGYNAAKYLPYGPVEKALPYLFRRAEENTSVGGQSSREVTLLKKEIARRRNL